MFSYLLKESELQYPKVLTTTEIQKRVGVSEVGAANLKRRLQLFAAELHPRMQYQFYLQNKINFGDFHFPKDRDTNLKDLLSTSKIPVPQADTVVLYSCGTLANKGRKRYKHKGQTSSIYLSDSLGGKQVGTLVNTLAAKNGPVFYDSIPNNKAETLNPILHSYLPVHNPIFTDMGYSLPSRNHRTINHSRKSKDKRYKWSRQRWSKNGIHCQVAEGKNSILKKSFAAYSWINPTYSNLYLKEYSFFANLRHFRLEDLLPDESLTSPRPAYQIDRNWTLRELYGRNIHQQNQPLKERIGGYKFEAKSLPQILQDEKDTMRSAIEKALAQIPDAELRNSVREANLEHAKWKASKTTQDQRRKQRYYEALAEKVWHMIPEHGYMEIHEVARKAKVSGKHIFRLMGIWTKLGMLETVLLSNHNSPKQVEFFDVRRQCTPLLPLKYIMLKPEVPEFNRQWRSKLRRIG
ncbi:MAG: transposase [Turneriella sp.]